MRDPYFGDVIYDVWRNGGDPDYVDRDDVDDCRYEGLYAEEAAVWILQQQREVTP